MNYDLDTDEGMANAIAWTNNHMAQIKEGGAWLIPRSGATVTVVNHSPKVAIFTEGWFPEYAVGRVLKAGGWALMSKEEAYEYFSTVPR